MQLPDPAELYARRATMIRLAARVEERAAARRVGRGLTSLDARIPPPPARLEKGLRREEVGLAGGRTPAGGAAWVSRAAR